MQRKPGFPHASCNIKIPDGVSVPSETSVQDDDPEQRRRLLLVNFGHAQWGFNNWSWAVTKQDLDFVDFSSGKYSAGVVAFVSVTVKSLDIHRENIGYATTGAPMKGSAVYQARKGAVTNALRETLLSFGGSVATDLLELLETHKLENTPAVPPAPSAVPAATHQAEPNHENNQNILNKLAEPKNVSKIGVVHPPRKDFVESPANVVARPPPQQQPAPLAAPLAAPPAAPPVAKALPMPARRPAANQPRPPPAPLPPPPPPAPLARPGSNEGAPGPAGDAAEEEARAERKRRQRQAQEDFRLKQMIKQKNDAEPDGGRPESRSSFDSLLLQLPSQDILIEETPAAPGEAKRKSPQAAPAPAASPSDAASSASWISSPIDLDREWRCRRNVRLTYRGFL